MKTKDFIKELNAAENADINNYYNLTAAELVQLLREAENRSEYEQDNAAHAATLAFSLGYARGYKDGEAAPARKRAQQAKLKRMQAEEIRARYSTEEIESILQRLKKGSLEDLTNRQALQIIAKREAN